VLSWIGSYTALRPSAGHPQGRDPAKTSQDFVPDAGEKDQPAWRVVQLNRK